MQALIRCKVGAKTELCSYLNTKVPRDFEGLIMCRDISEELSHFKIIHKLFWSNF